VAASFFDLTGSYKTAWLTLPALLIVAIVLVVVVRPVKEMRA
jgi:hypothetical protein